MTVDIERFEIEARDRLLDVRDLALDRRREPGSSPIDAHVEVIVNGAPELAVPGRDPGVGDVVTMAFPAVLAEVTGWQAATVPAVFGRIAAEGLPMPGGCANRSFGELVFAAFADILKDPKKYPQAREAFYISMERLARDLGEATLAAVRGLDARFEAMLERLDELSVFRDGASHTLGLLPRIHVKLDVVLRRIAHLESVPLDALRGILAEMGDSVQGADAAEIERRLRTKATDIKTLTDRLNRLSNDDPVVADLRRRTAAALRAGRFVEADGHLASAEARDLAGLDDLEDLARRKRLSAAESRGERAAAAMLRANPEAYHEATAHYAAAARIADSADPTIARRFRHEQGLALMALGDEFGDNEKLRESIEHFKSLIRSIDGKQITHEWIMLQVHLGNALARVGEREIEIQPLAQAIESYKSVLQYLSQEKFPRDWASVQANLGCALLSMGQRENRIDYLDQAVTSLRAALKEQDKEISPIDWAKTQMNLGSALLNIGQRNGETAAIEEAVSTHRLSLQKLDRLQFPLDWATTQMNLGVALQILGQYQNDNKLLIQAIEAYRLTMQEWTRNRVPLD